MGQEQEDIKNQYIKDLWNDHNYSITQFDSQVLYLSSGAFALSLTFLKDITPIAKAQNLWLFIVSLSLFTLSILLSFVSHYLSAKFIREQVKRVDKDDYSIVEEPWIPRLNKWMVFSLISGIIVLVIFSSINFYAMNDNNRKDAPKTEIPRPNIGDTINKGLPLRPMPQAISATPPSAQTPAQPTTITPPTNNQPK